MAGNTVLIDGGKIAALGIAGRDFDQQPGNHAEVLSFPGATIVPGLGDAHFHPLGYTAAVTRLSLKTTRDLADLADRLQAAAGRLRPGVPLIGQRLDDEALAERRLPDRHDLDRALADRPVVLYRYCGHVAVANTAALEAAAIVPGTVDPAGGGIDRDQSGVPNGILRETAVRLVAQALGGRTEGLDPADLLRAMSTLAALGLTRLGAIVSAGDPIWCGVGDELTSLIEVGPDLPFPVDVLVIADDEAMLESAARRLRRPDGSPMPLRGSAFSAGRTSPTAVSAVTPPRSTPPTPTCLPKEERYASTRPTPGGWLRRRWGWEEWWHSTPSAIGPTTR